MFKIVDDAPGPVPPAPGLTDERLAEIRENNDTRRAIKGTCPAIVRREGRRYDLDEINAHGQRFGLYTSDTGPNDATAWILHARTDPVDDEVADLLAEVDRLRRLEARWTILADFVDAAGRAAACRLVAMMKEKEGLASTADTARGGNEAGKGDDRG